MENVHDVLNYLLHLDKYLLSFVALHGAWTYLVVFAVIFCETGLVVTPFLPGDSLLFTLGSIAASVQNPLHILFLLPLLIIASILGNQVNYMIGRFVCPSIFLVDRPWLLNKKYLEEAGIPAMIYYPIPLNQQEAYCSIGVVSGSLNNTDNLCKSVISLPMHTELTEEQQLMIVDKIKLFFR